MPGTLQKPGDFSIASIMRTVAGLTPAEAQAQLGELARNYPHVPWNVLAAQIPPDEYSGLIKQGVCWVARFQSIVPAVGQFPRVAITNLRGSGVRVLIRRFTQWSTSSGQAQCSFGVRQPTVTEAVDVAPTIVSNLLASNVVAIDATKVRLTGLRDNALFVGADFAQKPAADAAVVVGRPFLAILDDGGVNATVDQQFLITQDPDDSSNPLLFKVAIEFAVVPSSYG